MPPPTPPEYGMGPANYARQGQVDPFSAFDSRIRYQDMVRYQMISQYQQNAVRPATMTLDQQRQIATQPRFQYGVQGGQDPRFYQRQAAMSRSAYGAGAISGAIGMGAWGAAEMGLGVMGVTGGLMGAMVLPAAAAMIPMYFINKGVQNAMERRKYMHSIAADIEQYRGQLGFNGGITYGQATQLGAGISTSMDSPGQFFSKEQQSRIHKIGLSNNLLSARGRGLDSGTMTQYKKNFEELKETTEDVVKLLQTTIEGGMSVIKELQQKGFGSMKQIRQQVTQAKAMGGFTGLGAQNMMQIGAAGAQAVQGTPWDATVGASMYQYGASQAHMIAQGGRGGANVVRRVGGVAQAGGVIGRFNMNMMSSGMGSKLAAYAMDSSGGVDERRLDRVLSGNASAYEISKGANRVGYGMGENRVRFESFKQDMMNDMSDSQRNQFTTSMFAAWSKQRPYSSVENKAFVFAGLGTNNLDEQKLIAQRLLTGGNFGQIEAQASVNRAMINPARAKRHYGRVGRAVATGLSAAGNAFDYLGEGIVSTGENIFGGLSDIRGSMSKTISRAFESTMQGVGIYDEYGRGGGNYGDNRSNLEQLYGLKNRGNVAAQGMAIANATQGDIDKIKRGKVNLGFNINAITKRASDAGNLGYIVQSLGMAVASGDPSKLLDDSVFIRTMDMTASQEKAFRKNVMGAIQNLATGILNAQESTNSKYEKAVGQYQTWKKKNSDNPNLLADNMQYLQDARRSLNTDGADFSLKTDLRGNKGTVSYETYNLMATELERKRFEGIDRTFLRQTNMAASVDRAAAERSFEIALDIGSEEYKSYYTTVKGRGGKYRTVKTAASQRDKRQRKFVQSFEKEFDIDLDTTEGQAAFSRRLRKTHADAATFEGFESERDRKFYKKAKDYYGFEGIERLVDKAKDIDLADAVLSGGKAAINFLGGMRYDKKRFKSKEGVDKFSGAIQKLFTGEELSAAEFGTLKSQKAAIAEREKVTPEVLSQHMGSASDLRSFLTKNAAARAWDTPNIKLNQITDDLKELAGRKAGETAKILVTDSKSGKVGEMVVTDDNAAEAEKILGVELTKMQINAVLGKGREGSQGGGLAATVRPPVLNYWNNRWTL